MASKAAKKSSKKTVAKARVKAKPAKKAGKTTAKKAGKTTAKKAMPSVKASANARSAKPAGKVGKRKAPAGPQAIPAGYGTLTPFLNINGASDAIEFYKKAFGAVERLRMPGPDGKVMHAELKIGDSILMLSDAIMAPETRSALHIYVKDCDALFAQAVAAGATATAPPTDMFWGDRFARLADPFGNQWAIATHTEDVSPAEMQKRMAALPPPGAPPAAA
jgi:PhnB protein